MILPGWESNTGHDPKILSAEYNGWKTLWSVSSCPLSLPPDSKHLPRLNALLARIRHFDALPDEVQERIAAVASPRHFESDKVIYLEGEPAESVFLIERGWVKATRIALDGREQAMLFLHSGEVFGI